MKKNILLLAAVLVFSTLLTSCSEDTVYEVSSDCAISSFVLGNIKRTIHTTTEDGKDSTYASSYPGKYFPMNIDQINGTITNDDSLLHNSDLRKVLITVSASSALVYRPADNPKAELIPYSATDSIDLSKPLVFISYSEDGSARKQYTVSLKVHQQEADKFVWNESFQTEKLDGMLQTKALVWKDKLSVWGLVAGKMNMASTAVSDGKTWTLAESQGCTNADPKTIQVFAGKLYVSCGNGDIYSSEDGIQWHLFSQTYNGKLVGASMQALYIVAGEKLYHSTDGMEWKADQLDEDASWLPSRDFASVCYKLPNGNSNLLLLGNRDNQIYSDPWAVVWGKLLVGQDADARGWMHYVVSTDNRYTCPPLKDLALFRYDDKIIAAGDKAINDAESKPLNAFYISKDNGITWKIDGDIVPPTDASLTEGPISITTDNQYHIWLVRGTKIWKGRLNKLGFQDTPTVID